MQQRHILLKPQTRPYHQWLSVELCLIDSEWTHSLIMIHRIFDVSLENAPM